MGTLPSYGRQATLSMSTFTGQQLNPAACPPMCFWLDRVAWHVEQQPRVHLSLIAEPYARIQICTAVVKFQSPLRIAFIASLACAQPIS